MMIPWRISFQIDDNFGAGLNELSVDTQKNELDAHIRLNEPDTPRKTGDFSGIVDLFHRSFKLAPRKYDSWSMKGDTLYKYYISGEVYDEAGRYFVRAWIYPGFFASLLVVFMIVIVFRIFQYADEGGYKTPEEEYKVLAMMSGVWLLIIGTTIFRVRKVKKFLQKYFLRNQQFIIS